MGDTFERRFQRVRAEYIDRITGSCGMTRAEATAEADQIIAKVERKWREKQEVKQHG